MKVLNLCAGLGGNRQKWTDCEVTAVEMNPDIAEVYRGQFPSDTIIIGDAHQYLLDHHGEYDFVWDSDPCQSHTKMIRSGRNRKPRYPDLRLYEKILFLQYNFKGLWVVENVVPYYEPLIKPTIKLGRHLVWSNFPIANMVVPVFKNMMNRQNLTAKAQMMDWLGIHYDKVIYYDGNHCPTQVLRNCVPPPYGIAYYELCKGI